MTMPLKWTPWRFTWKIHEQNIREFKKEEEIELSKILQKLVWKTFAEIEKIVRNIWDHPNPNLLIDNLAKLDDFNETKKLLAKAIKNSTYSVEKILDIK
jgi:hypothetical protein